MVSRNSRLPNASAASDDADVVGAALRFRRSLRLQQRAELQCADVFEVAERWSNFPQGYLGSAGRFGLATDSLSAPQWVALENLLAAATGGRESTGFRDVLDHLDADDELVARGAGSKYGRGRFFVALLGEPNATGRWRLQFGGHHFALLHAYLDGHLVGATPMFRGIEPFSPFQARGGVREPERATRDAFARLLTSLEAEQAAAARLPHPAPDLLLGPGRDWMFPPRGAGILGQELDAAQRDQLLTAIRGFVDRLPALDAERVMLRYARELDDTAVAYRGAPSLTRPGAYVRVDGPSVWIEFSMHDGIVLDQPHPHTVWRDRQHDYGGLRPQPHTSGTRRIVTVVDFNT